MTVFFSTRPLKENQLVQDSTERAFLSYSRQKWIRAERKLNLGARVWMKNPASFCFSQQHNSSQDDAITPVTVHLKVEQQPLLPQRQPAEVLHNSTSSTSSQPLCSSYRTTARLDEDQTKTLFALRLLVCICRGRCRAGRKTTWGTLKLLLQMIL